MTNDIAAPKIYDEQDYFDFEIMVNKPLLDGDITRSPFYGVYTSQLISFTRMCSNVCDFRDSGYLPLFRSLDILYVLCTAFKAVFLTFNSSNQNLTVLKTRLSIS